jgi:hypothetical protein
MLTRVVNVLTPRDVPCASGRAIHSRLVGWPLKRPGHRPDLFNLGDDLARSRPLRLLNAAFSLAAGGARLTCAADAFRQILAIDTASDIDAYARMTYTFRLWEVGQWTLHDGRSAVAEQIARDLAARSERSAGPMDRLLARSLEARVALARGDTAKAIAILETIVPTTAPAT